MESPRQRTLARAARLDGPGVHSGEAATLTVRSAPVDHGLRFRRVDLEGEPEIRAVVENVVDTRLGTSLGEGEARVLTVEHVMAALAAHGITNAVLELSGPEPPIRDGSFRDYWSALEEAGVVDQDADARVITVHEPVTAQESAGESYVVTPAERFRVSATIEFEHPAIGRSFGSFTPDRDFEDGLAPARTFGFRADAEALRANGLARGAALDNTIVLDDEGVMNPEGLRFGDEFLRHKVGDLIGDLWLLGAHVVGHVVAERPSHRGNLALAKALAEHALRGDGQPIVDAQQIMQYLPHRFPMLLVDRIIGFESGKRIVGIKNVTINEPFFQGHYPGHPIMPGVLIIEAMAQVGGLLLMDAVEKPEDKVVYFMSLNDVKWRRPVTPGDQIVFELEMLQFRRHVCKMRGVGRVDGNVVAEAELLARIMDR